MPELKIMSRKIAPDPVLFNSPAFPTFSKLLLFHFLLQLFKVDGAAAATAFGAKTIGWFKAPVHLPANKKEGSGKNQPNNYFLCHNFTIKSGTQLKPIHRPGWSYTRFESGATSSRWFPGKQSQRYWHTAWQKHKTRAGRKQLPV